MTSGWLDFTAIRRDARFDAVLAHYRFKLTRHGSRRFILCPFHREETPSCSIDLSERLFHCFGCGTAGTVIDFVARLDRIELREAAAKVAALSAEAGLRTTDKTTIDARRDPSTSEANPSLSYRLTLDPTHPYLRSRGVDADIIASFGLGYCDSGMMRGRICIPVRNHLGRLVAYAGRWASDQVPAGIPRYLFSRGFRKREVLFNLDRSGDSGRIILVEGYWSVFRLHTMGIASASLMGCTISKRQIALLRTRGITAIGLLLDGDEAGWRARERLIGCLVGDFYLKAPRLEPGEKPDTLDEKKLLGLVAAP